MGFIDNIRQIFSRGAIPAQGKSWENLFRTAQEWKLFNDDVNRPYAQVVAVYEAIRFIADNVTQLDIKFYNRGNDKEVQNDAIEKLFRDPNPQMSFHELIEAAIIFNRIYGEAFFVYETSIGQQAGTTTLPAQIWPFSPKDFSPVLDHGNIVGWRFGGRALLPEQVLHFKDFNPYNYHRGLSPLDPLKQVISVDWQSLLYSKSFFENDATPGFMLSTEKTLSEIQVNRLREWFEKRHKGAKNAHKMAILEGGLKPSSVGTTQKDMEFIEQKKYYREEILGVFRVPKAIFSITENLNYATFIGQKRMFWTDTLMPIVKRLEGEINSQFFNRFAPDVYCRFDFSNVIALQEDLNNKLDAAQKMIALGYPLNMVNEKLELGMDDVDWGNVSWMDANKVPVASDEILIPPPTQDAPKIEGGKGIGDKIADDFMRGNVKAFFTRQGMLEIKIAKKISRFFYNQRVKVLRSLNNKSVKTAFVSINWDDEADKFKEMMEPLIERGVKEGATNGQEGVGVSLADDVIESRLKSYTAFRLGKSREIVKRWGAHIVNLVGNAVTEGKTVNEIADLIRHRYTVAANRAMTIARTESTGALNGGKMTYYQEAGVKYKTWLTAQDGEVRDWHVNLHGEKVLIGSSFSNGLDFPGGDGPPEEVINCRCTYTGSID